MYMECSVWCRYNDVCAHARGHAHTMNMVCECEMVYDNIRTIMQMYFCCTLNGIVKIFNAIENALQIDSIVE